ncbi:unnamed protein product [Acanthosepion pharaonis]|uniref:Uncharacterized protein n=1 Tax=Acanthosepion pharaonis TaxID=158019 RepID=A0A812EJQ4_ACAPH|nr:unnamed protein product [Sepia pharaonis]
MPLISRIYLPSCSFSSCFPIHFPSVTLLDFSLWDTFQSENITAGNYLQSENSDALFTIRNRRFDVFFFFLLIIVFTLLSILDFPSIFAAFIYNFISVIFLVFPCPIRAKFFILSLFKLSKFFRIFFLFLFFFFFLSFSFFLFLSFFRVFFLLNY